MFGPFEALAHSDLHPDLHLDLYRSICRSASRKFTYKFYFDLLFDLPGFVWVSELQTQGLHLLVCNLAALNAL